MTMSFETDFDFGVSPEIKLASDEYSPGGIDKVVNQIRHMQLGRKDTHTVGEVSSDKLRNSLDSSFSFELPDSPVSPLSSAASIHSAATAELPTSSYWHIPDKHSYLTSIAMQEDSSLCAIGSGAHSNNLFVYEVYPDEVTHHQTVTLPEIHSLKWASPKTQLGQMGNILVSGHKSGVAHLTMLPDTNSRDGSAEILKRYNHAKHLPHPSLGGSRSRSLRIRTLDLTSPNWSCTVPSSIFSLCGDHLFLWEPNRSDVPLVMQKTHSTNTLGLCNDRDGVYALGRRKGVCIRDIRIRDRVNSGLKPPVDNDESVSLVKWNPYDGGNQLAAVHDRTTIKIWDIRSKEPLATYKRHADTINSIEWSAKSELVSASADGTVRVWDVDDASNSVKPLNTPEKSLDRDNGIQNTTWNDYIRRQSLDLELEGFANDLLTGVLPINQSRQFVSMSLAQMGPSIGALTIDGGCFLGIHELGDIHGDPRGFSASSLDLNRNSLLAAL